MITKNDCLTLLVKMEDEGIDIKDNIKVLMMAKELPLSVLKFIQQNRGIEVNNFYEMLRKKHNEKKSELYKNIMDETDDINTALVTLASLQTQILLYSRKLDNKEKFYKETRVKEIAATLYNYFKDLNELQLFIMLKAIKTDILVLEYVAGRREAE